MSGVSLLALILLYHLWVNCQFLHAYSRRSTSCISDHGVSFFQFFIHNSLWILIHVLRFSDLIRIRVEMYFLILRLSDIIIWLDLTIIILETLVLLLRVLNARSIIKGIDPRIDSIIYPSCLLESFTFNILWSIILLGGRINIIICQARLYFILLHRLEVFPLWKWRAFQFNLLLLSYLVDLLLN